MKRALLPLMLMAAFPTAQAQEPCEASEVRVATLNTWGLPPPLAPRRKSRFEQIQDYVADGFDVVGLQEVWSSARSLLPTLLRLPTTEDDSGLAVVTPHASTKPRLTPFSRAAGPDALKRKGYLHSKVTIPDVGETWVVVTHLQAGESRRASEIRGSQVDELLSWVRATEGPTLVMGDFNLYPELQADLEAARRLEAAGLTDLALQQGATDGTYIGHHARLDRIYARGERLQAVDAKVAPPSSMSDHRAVEATLTRCTAPVAAAE